MKITITIENKIAACSVLWDQFLPPGHHLQSRHLQAFENATIDLVQTSYLQVLLKDKLIGLVYLQQYPFKHQHIKNNGQNALLLRCIRLLLPAELQILVCGHLFRIDFQGFYFEKPAQQFLVFEAIRLFIQQDKKNKPAAIIIKDCMEFFANSEYKKFGYRFFDGDVTMELVNRVHWNSFDDYLKDLNKNYRQRAKKIFSSFEGIECREFNANDIFAHAGQIEQLYLQVVNKQDFKLGIVNARYFSELKKDLQQGFEFHGLFLAGQMVGFYTFIFYTDYMETHFIGLDYEANKTYKLYFNILFLSTQKMIEKKYQKLELGRTAKETKLNLGAKPKQIFNFIKINNPVLNYVMQCYLNQTNRTKSKSIQERNPLK